MNEKSLYYKNINVDFINEKNNLHFIKQFRFYVIIFLILE